MQKIYPLLFSIVLMSCALALPPAGSLPPAGPTEKMIDGADKILLTVSETPDAAYRNFVQYLSDQGFGFVNTDQLLMVLKTDFKEVKHYSYSINSSISGDNETVVQISGNGQNPKLGLFEIRNEGHRLSYQRVSWGEMQKLARAYPHTKILYKRN